LLVKPTDGETVMVRRPGLHDGADVRGDLAHPRRGAGHRHCRVQVTKGDDRMFALPLFKASAIETTVADVGLVRRGSEEPRAHALEGAPLEFTKTAPGAG
jgi:hypothetical protein